MTQTSFSYPQPVAPVWQPAHGHSVAAAPGYRLGFILFMLVNATLFLRPTEIFHEYFYSQTYLVLILACFVVSVPCVIKQLARAALVAQPVTVCVLGLVAAIALSHLTRFAFESAFFSALEFGKVALYYLLFLGLVSSSGRLRQFLFWLVVFVLGQTLVAVLQYHGVIQNDYFDPAKEEVFEAVIPVIRGVEYIIRLCGSGIFHNPNELCYPIGMAMIACLFYVGHRALPLRAFGLASLLFFGYAITLTHSRGGFIGLLFGSGSFLLARFGWRRAVPFAAVMLPVLFYLFAGRMTSIDTSSDTAQSRIQLWNQGLVDFTRNPLFGLGTGLFQEKEGLVAHNSYIQAYSELGFFGGTLFVGAFYLCLWALYRLGLCQEQIIDPEMRRLRPYLVGLVGGFMGCMVSMSLTDMLPTYAVLAVVVAYVRLTALRRPLPIMPQFNSGLVLRLAGASMLTLVVFRVYVWFTFVV
jgi:hypothetical protein